MTLPVSVAGSWAPAYELVVDSFTRAVGAAPPGGGSLAVYVAGELVVDVWAGIARPRQKTPWREDTLAVTFSCTKGLLASCALLAAQRGELELDSPVASYWPELAAGPVVTPRMVLSHRAGLPALDADLTTEEALAGTQAVAALERQRPLWTPGSGHAYHAMTYGWLVAEILHRSTGRSLTQHLDDLLTGPEGYGGRDTWLGLPPDGEARLAEAAWDLSASDLRFPPDNPGVGWRRRTITRSITLGGAFPPELVGPGTGFNDSEIVRRGVPALGIVSTARSLARSWARLVTPMDGAPALLNAASRADAARCRSEGRTVLGTPGPHARWASGHMLRSTLAPMLSELSFGHDGAGGQLCFADPGTQVGFAFLANVLRNRDDTRSRSIVDALGESLMCREQGGDAKLEQGGLVERPDTSRLNPHSRMTRRSTGPD